MTITPIVWGPDRFRGSITLYWRPLRSNCVIFADRMRIQWSHSASLLHRGEIKRSRTRSRIGLQVPRRGHNFIENFATYIHKTTLRTDGTKDVALIHFDFAR